MTTAAVRYEVTNKSRPGIQLDGREPLPDARYIRLRLGYVFDRASFAVLARRLDDGTVAQLPVFSPEQRQHFACSAVLPWFFPIGSTR